MTTAIAVWVGHNEVSAVAIGHLSVITHYLWREEAQIIQVPSIAMSTY